LSEHRVKVTLEAGQNSESVTTVNHERQFRSLGVLEKMREFHLPPVPYFQILVKRTIMRFDYQSPRKTHISVDGLEHLDSDEPMLLAMNHTDRFNYLPFMRKLDLLGYPPLAPWVKGKYYQNRYLSQFLCLASCIPIPSRGFLLTLDWLARTGRQPNKTEYRQLRLMGDGAWTAGLEMEPTVAEYLRQGPGGTPENYFEEFQRHFEGLTGSVVRINKEAMELGYRPLIFPQGTRSRHLTQGFSGIVQMALHMGVRIVPVGVSGSDLCYPGDNPFSKGGHVHYSVGEPFDPNASPEAPKDFIPLTIRASRDHGAEFEALTGQLMDRINELLPAEYQYAESLLTQKQGAERFV
jgi:1-acyl-sn-glycerol-3-phosphate acyltransferase